MTTTTTIQLPTKSPNAAPVHREPVRIARADTCDVINRSLAIAGESVLDTITARHTAFATFRELVVLTASNYRPTLYTDALPNKSRRCIEVRAELRILADAYDKAQEQRGDSRRVYRV